MAYLTKSSYNQLIERIELKDVDRIDKEFFKSNIFDNEYLFYFFNQFELKKILTEKILLSGEEQGILIFKDVPQREDNFNFIISIEGKVKYHKNSQCTALYKGFKNFFMPDAVVRLKEIDEEKHKKLVVEIRQWFVKNNYTVERYEAGEINDLTLTKEYNKTFPKRYGIENIFISESDKGQFNWYLEKKASGIEQTEKSFNHDKFMLKIVELIQKRDFLCNSKTMQSLSKFDFLLNKNNDEIIEFILNSISNNYLKNVEPIFFENYGIDNLKKFWISHLELKKEAMELLSGYFKWTYNYNESTFTEIFLEDFNLQPCRLCYEDHEIFDIIQRKK